MIAICPNCQKKLKLGPKVESSLRMLSPGKSLRINCPQCEDAILLDANSMMDPQAPVKTADSSTPVKTADSPTPVKTADSPTPRPTNQQITPPPPPDLFGLSKNAYEGKEMIEDTPKVLVLMPDSPNRRLTTDALEDLGYQPSFVQSAEDAMEKMQFINYASVILHSRYEDSALENGVFHQFMRAMNMNKRRYIFYILIGPEFHSLYGLEALACSANLVINDQDLPRFAIILRTAIPQHERMFGAIMQELNVLGQ